jgi:hypothetical protein
MTSNRLDWLLEYASESTINTTEWVTFLESMPFTESKEEEFTIKLRHLLGRPLKERKNSDL